MGLEPTNLLTASQALYQLSYAPAGRLRYQGRWASPEALGPYADVGQYAGMRLFTLPGRRPPARPFDQVGWRTGCRS